MAKCRLDNDNNNIIMHDRRTLATTSTGAARCLFGEGATNCSSADVVVSSNTQRITTPYVSISYKKLENDKVK
jgi:hypothetical protein